MQGKACPECGGSFASGNPQRVYCCNLCACRAWHKRKPRQPKRNTNLGILKCACCDEWFVPRRSRTQRCCSAECSSALKNAQRYDRRPQQCEHCEHEFIGNLHRRFCSERCSTQDRNKRHRESGEKCRARTVCTDCGIAFTPQRYQRRCDACLTRRPHGKAVAPHSWPPSICATCTRPIESSGKRYCSHACWVAERYERRCTACGGLWNPTDRPFSQAATECWPCRSASHVEGGRDWTGVHTFRKQQLVRRENGQCEDCGTTEETAGAPLHAHHIRAQALGGSHDLDNLKLLCEECHTGSGWARNHADLIAAGLVIAPVGTQLALAA